MIKVARKAAYLDENGNVKDKTKNCPRRSVSSFNAASHATPVNTETEHASALRGKSKDGDEDEVVVHPILPTSALVTNPIGTILDNDGSGLVDGGIPKLA